MEGCSGAACAPEAAAVIPLLLLVVPRRRPPGTNDGALARNCVDPASFELVAELSTPDEEMLRAAEGALLRMGLGVGTTGWRDWGVPGRAPLPMPLGSWG